MTSLSFATILRLMAKQATVPVNGATIRAMRELLGLEAKELARRATMSASYLCEIEGGDKQPSAAVRKRIADALGVDVASLICPVPKEATASTGGTARAS